jgi:hypothetical protein
MINIELFLKKNHLFFGDYIFFSTFALPNELIIQLKADDSVAQLVEQYTFNVWALGSSPSGITRKPCADKLHMVFYFSRLPLPKYFRKSATITEVLFIKKSAIASIHHLRFFVFFILHFGQFTLTITF